MNKQAVLHKYAEYFLTNNREVMEPEDIAELEEALKPTRDELINQFDQYIKDNNIVKSRGINWIWLNKLTDEQSKLLFGLIEAIGYDNRGIYTDADDNTFSISYR